MKRKLFILFILFSGCFSLFSQHKVDTIYILDSIWRNDTLFIVKKMHLTVIIEDNEQTIDTQNNIKPPVNIYTTPIPLEPIRKKFVNYNHISPVFEIGLYDVKKSQQNYFLDSTIKKFQSTTFGILFDFEQTFFRYSLGMQITNFYEVFEFFDKWNIIDSTIKTIVEVNTFWNVDTFWYLNLDSLLIGDTVWTPYYDSNQFVVYDTSYKTLYDTTKNQRDYQRTNKIRFVEIPFIIGFNYTIKRWTFSVNTGFVLGIPFLNDYRIALPRDMGIVTGTFSKTAIWSYSKFNIKFRAAKNFYINSGMFYRFALNNQLAILNQKRRIISYGLNLGVSIRIN